MSPTSRSTAFSTDLPTSRDSGLGPTPCPSQQVQSLLLYAISARKDRSTGFFPTGPTLLSQVRCAPPPSPPLLDVGAPPQRSVRTTRTAQRWVGFWGSARTERGGTPVGGGPPKTLLTVGFLEGGEMDEHMRTWLNVTQSMPQMLKGSNL